MPQKPISMGYCSGKLTNNFCYLQLFYKRNTPHFLWIYRRNKPTWDVETEHSQSLLITRLRFVIYKPFSSSSNIQRRFNTPLNSWPKMPDIFCLSIHGNIWEYTVIHGHTSICRLLVHLFIYNFVLYFTL